MEQLTVLWHNYGFPATTTNYEPYNSDNTSLIDAGDGSLIATWLARGGGYNYAQRPKQFHPTVEGNKYYFSYMIKPAFAGTNFSVEFGGGTIPEDSPIAPINEWTRYSFIANGQTTSSQKRYYIPNVRWGGTLPVAGCSVQFKNILYIDLTRMFGSGFEPKTVEQFEYECAINGINIYEQQEYNDTGTSRTWNRHSEPKAEEIRANLERLAPHPVSTNGEQVNFSNSENGFLKECIGTHYFSQAGSGRPTPSNVRTISGFTKTDLTIRSSDPDVAEQKLEVEEYPQTEYGLQIDYISGNGYRIAAMYTFDGDEQWGDGDSYGGGHRFYTMTAGGYTSDAEYGGDNTSVLGCNYLQPAPNGQSTNTGTYGSNIITFGSYNPQIYVNVDFCSTVSEWTTYLSNHPLQVVYKIASPLQAYGFTFNKPKSFRGANTIFINGAGNIDTTFWSAARDTNKYSISRIPVLIDNSFQPLGTYGQRFYDYDLMSTSNYFITGFYDTGSETSKKYALHQVPKFSDDWPRYRWFNNKNDTCVDYYAPNAGSTRIVDAYGRYLIVTVYKPEAGKFFIFDVTNNKFVIKGGDIDSIYGGLPCYLDNYYYNHGNGAASGSITSDSNFFIAGPFDTGSSDSKNYTINNIPTSGSLCDIRYFNDLSSTSYDYWGIVESNGYRTFSSGGRYILASVRKDLAANFSIYDNTNQRYIYKGVNVA